MKGEILVVEDEATIQRVIKDYLTAAGYSVHCTGDGLDAIRLFEKHHPDLIVLDINIPSMNGLEVASFIRKTSDVYIIMLTARTDEDDQITGLESGADDYVTKPFSPRTLVARVDAAMRRKRGAGTNHEELCFQHVCIDARSREAWTPEKTIDLTFTEFNLLIELARHVGQVLSRPQLLDLVWGTGYAGNDRVVDVYVGQVRRKLEEATGMVLIQTVRGAGYKFTDEKAP